LEGIEDGLDRIDERVERTGSHQPLEERLDRIEAALARLEAATAAKPAAPRRRTPPKTA
jgi:hypothetical protein